MEKVERFIVRFDGVLKKIVELFSPLEVTEKRVPEEHNFNQYDKREQERQNSEAVIFGLIKNE